MKNAKVLTPPSTDLSGILLFVRTQYSGRTRYEINQHFIDAREEDLPTPQRNNDTDYRIT